MRDERAGTQTIRSLSVHARWRTAAAYTNQDGRPSMDGCRSHAHVRNEEETFESGLDTSRQRRQRDTQANHQGLQKEYDHRLAHSLQYAPHGI